MTFDAWLTLAVLAVMFIALIKDLLGPDVVTFTALVVLWASGVIDTSAAVSGFSNPQVLTVALLFVVASAVQQTGALDFLRDRLLGSPTPLPLAMARLLAPVAFLSAFLNNTPIVAMFIPIVRDWARRHKLPPSRFLMPLSFAAILGGTCTLIGTSTNLVVSGLLAERGFEPLGMFELSVFGVPITVAGILYLSLVGWRLIPQRDSPDEDEEVGEARRYSVTVHVKPHYPSVGKTIEQAGLRHLEGLFLVEIRRGSRRIFPVRPTDLVKAGDTLVLYGKPETVVQLLSTDGFVVDDGENDADSEHGASSSQNVHEIVIREGSPLAGHSLREANFRRRYDAAVIGIYRGGVRLRQKLGQVRLRPYDTLLVLAAGGFRSTFATSRDFYLLGMSPTPPEPRKTWTTLIALVLMIAMIATGLVSPLLSVAIAAVFLVVTRCVEAAGARRSVNLSVIVVIASAFGLSNAVTSSGLADIAARSAELLVGDATPIVALALLYLVCSVVTETLSNNAAAALIFPIAISVGEGLGLDPRPFAIVVCVAASLSFITPMGYQTNLLVYGPGGYRFKDFSRVGLPLAAIAFTITMICAWLTFDMG